MVEKVQRVCEMKNCIVTNLYHKPEIKPGELLHTLKEYREMVKPYVCDVSSYLNRAICEGKTILLEGQLGTLKDPDHGIYPMVTSSSTLAAFGAVGAGIPPYEIKEILAVCKAYSSAVGAGAFVSEIFGNEAEELRRRGGDGGEYGATTGRPRRMGWNCDIRGIRRYEELPQNCRNYIEFIEKQIGYPITMISNGPGREDIIYRESPLCK